MKSTKMRCLAVGCLLFGATVFFGSGRPALATPFTNSSQLKLSGKLAAVNFYYNPKSQDPDGDVQVTGTIQGATIDNLDVRANNNVAFPLTGGGSLTISLPHTGEDRAQLAQSTIVGTGADEAQAEALATVISYFANGEAGSLTFSFGAGQANRPVQVQLVGGDETWGGTLQASVAGDIKGTFSGDNNKATAELLTFSATTTGTGGLVVNLNQVGGNFVGIAGVIVSAVPEPSTLVLGLVGLAGLLFGGWRRHKSR